jgi:hypothetical protein
LKILRDQRGLHDKNIGMGNEKSINQLIAHHSIIFEPEKQLVWVSTEPCQLGKYVCYNLDKVFSKQMIVDHEIYDSTLTIPPDSFLYTSGYRNFLKFHPFQFPYMNPHVDVNEDSLVDWNPESYVSWMVAGDRAFKSKDFKKATTFYDEALTKEVATEQEKEYIEKQINSSEKRK